MSKGLRLYVAGLVVASVLSLAVTGLVLVGQPHLILGMHLGIALAQPATPETMIAGLAIWTVITLFASALPVQMPRGTQVSVSTPPIVAAMLLGGPVAAGWVAAIGTTELREIRGRVPWYGTLSNHAGIVIPAIAGALVIEVMRPWGTGAPYHEPFYLLATLVGTGVYFALNVVIAAIGTSLYRDVDFRRVVSSDTRSVFPATAALAPLAWLMALIYLGVGWWATLLFGLPLYTTRLAQQSVVEMRSMFTQTIGALAEAVDKRDPFTSKHSRRVMEIASDIGRVMRLSEADMEALEWGGLLHDVGKIGVPDHVLLKADRLTREERAVMNSHPVLGAQIIAPVTKLAPELPIIRHHHEWYNGSGYPDRLIGEEIPRLARVLHVADAFEAMTAARPYRMIPLSTEQALAELRKFAGIQFDPEVVDAFVRTGWVEGARDPGRGPASGAPVPLHPLPPLIGDHGAAAARGSRTADLS